jgi:hypothetical protein
MQSFGTESEGKKCLGRRFVRHEYNIKMDLKDAGWETVNWINPAHIRDKCAVLNTVIYCCVREISWLAEEPVSFKENCVPCSLFCE